jgi:hypothetical protein
MGWSSFKLQPGEKPVDFILREVAPDLVEAREIAPGVVAVILLGPATWAPYRTPAHDGLVRFAGVALFEGGYVKYMEEGCGPYHAGKFPADMLAKLSPIEGEPPLFVGLWLDRQKA